jgi:hypothetical protein
MGVLKGEYELYTSPRMNYECALKKGRRSSIEITGHRLGKSNREESSKRYNVYEESPRKENLHITGEVKPRKRPMLAPNITLLVGWAHFLAQPTHPQVYRQLT